MLLRQLIIDVVDLDYVVVDLDYVVVMVRKVVRCGRIGAAFARIG